MKRLCLSIGFATLGLTIVFAQGTQNADPDRMMKGGSALPAGWMARLDSGSTKIDGVQLMSMGKGLHFITGPAGIYYSPGDKRSGAYEVHATFTQLEASPHPEAYGLFIGGSDLDNAKQKYSYFEVRQDGYFLIKRRSGEATPTVTDWTANAAVRKTDRSAKGVNTLAIVVAAAKVRFLSNGTEVAALAPSQLDTSGVAGLRINHNLNVQVDGFEVK